MHTNYYRLLHAARRARREWMHINLATTAQCTQSQAGVDAHNSFFTHFCTLHAKPGGSGCTLTGVRPGALREKKMRSTRRTEERRMRRAAGSEVWGSCRNTQAHTCVYVRVCVCVRVCGWQASSITLSLVLTHAYTCTHAWCALVLGLRSSGFVRHSKRLGEP
jgi:hypothetical protein